MIRITSKETQFYLAPVRGYVPAMSSSEAGRPTGLGHVLGLTRNDDSLQGFFDSVANILRHPSKMISSIRFYWQIAARRSGSFLSVFVIVRVGRRKRFCRQLNNSKTVSDGPHVSMRS